MKDVIVRRAVLWFEGKRPADWTKEQHLLQPMVNCANEAERLLAISVASTIEEWKK